MEMGGDESEAHGSRSPSSMEMCFQQERMKPGTEAHGVERESEREQTHERDLTVASPQVQQLHSLRFCNSVSF